MALTVGEIIFTAINGLILLWCVFSNTCVIGIVLRTKRMRNPTNMLICNLALSDILLGGIVLPQNLHDISHTEDFHEGEFACRTVNFLPVLLIITSIYTLVAMSFERYRAIVISSASSVLTKSQMGKIIGMIWVGSAMCTIPSLIEYSIYYVPYTVPIPDAQENSTETNVATTSLYTDTTQTSMVDVNDAVATNFTSSATQAFETLYVIRCGSNGVPWLFSLCNGLFLLTVAYLIPTVLIWVQYGKLIRYIIEFTKRQSHTGKGDTRFVMFEKKVKIVKMLVIVAALFEVCWLPYFSLLIYAKSTGQDDSTMFESWPNMLRISLSSFSVSYNAVLYIVYNAQFKAGFRRILCPCKPHATAANQIAPTTAVQTTMFQPSMAGRTDQ